MKAHVKSYDDIKITACTITKNEEKTIARSINSYKKYVDEIIIVDTGSTDGTVKEAEKLGAKILHFKWCNDFSAAKNTAIDAASGDWIIFLDADEYFADDSAKNIRKAIKLAEMAGKNAIGCRYENIDVDCDNAVTSEGFQIRVFKRGVRYHNPVHEELYSDNFSVLAVERKYFYFKHTGYSQNVSDQKSKRNLEIIYKELETTKDERRKAALYSYLSDCYLGLKDYKKCRDYAEKFLEKSKELKFSLLGCEIRPYFNIIQSLEQEKAAPEEIEPYINEFVEKYPESADARYKNAVKLLNQFRFNEALGEFKKAIELSNNDNNTYMNTVLAHKADIYFDCGKCEEGLGHTTEAMDWYFKAFEEDCSHSASLFSLFNIVRKMPQTQIDAFVEPMYRNASVKKYITVLSALMCNYMTPQLIKCYASYKAQNDDKLNADITAFIMAGQGKYEAASNIFYLSYEANKNSGSALRSLLFAMLSGNEELIQKSLEICTKPQAFSLGLAKRPELSMTDISEMAVTYIECERTGKVDFATKIMGKVLPNLNSYEILRLSEFLINSSSFETALYAAQQADITAKSVFMQGYCLYRLRRLNEASELLLLAKSMGFKNPGFDEVYNSIEALREKNSGVAPQEIKQLRERINNELEAGDYGSAGRDITTYLRVAEPDVELLSADAAILYYIGEYKKAAIAAECGLLKDKNNFDLLYNAACIYEKLGDAKRSELMYKRALKYCKDESLADEIQKKLN